MAKFYKKNTAYQRNILSRIIHKRIKIPFKVKIIILLIITAVLIHGNFTLCISNYSYISEKMPQSFDGYKIAQISDFHNTKNQIICNSVLESLNNEKPDIIFITGDFIDFNKTDCDYSVEFAEELCKIAPCYFVTGNHEIKYSVSHEGEYTKYVEKLNRCGVCILSSETVGLEKGNEVIYLSGIDDLYKRSYPLDGAADYLCNKTQSGDGINILLAHQPQEIEVYSSHGFDLVFCGHAHGGQIRLFGHGLYAPDQGILPEYSGGVYELDGTTEIVSRGIGNSIIPVRVFDRPELIYCTLASH